MTNTNNPGSTRDIWMTDTIRQTTRLVARVQKNLEHTKLRVAATERMIADSLELLRQLEAARRRSSPAPD